VCAVRKRANAVFVGDQQVLQAVTVNVEYGKRLIATYEARADDAEIGGPSGSVRYRIAILK
jgi:hypothetical protein